MRYARVYQIVVVWAVGWERGGLTLLQYQVITTTGSTHAKFDMMLCKSTLNQSQERSYRNQHIMNMHFVSQTGGDNKRVHSWMGTEPWIPFKDFSNMLHSPPYSVILNCDSWQVLTHRLWTENCEITASSSYYLRIRESTYIDNLT